MLLRSTALLCLTSGLCLAASSVHADNPFSGAIKRAIPSPFAADAGKSPQNLLRLDLNQSLFQPGPNQFSLGPDLSHVTIETPHSCAIPLVSMQIPTNKDYAIRKYETPKASLDNMAKAPAIPACPSK